MKELIAFWVSFLATHSWHDLIKNIEPKKVGCGIVYELPHLSKPGQDFAIVDMREIAVAEPHYHINGETELYFVLQGTAVVVVGKQERHVQKGDVIVTLPHTTHFTISDKDFVLAVVSTPSVNMNNYVPIFESDATVGFDKEQYERLVDAKYSQGIAQ